MPRSWSPRSGVLRSLPTRRARVSSTDGGRTRYPRGATPVYLLEDADGLEQWLQGVDGTFYIGFRDGCRMAAYSADGRARSFIWTGPLDFAAVVVHDHCAGRGGDPTIFDAADALRLAALSGRLPARPEGSRASRRFGLPGRVPGERLRRHLGTDPSPGRAPDCLDSALTSAARPAHCRRPPCFRQGPARRRRGPAGSATVQPVPPTGSAQGLSPACCDRDVRFDPSRTPTWPSSSRGAGARSWSSARARAVWGRPVSPPGSRSPPAPCWIRSATWPASSTPTLPTPTRGGR